KRIPIKQLRLGMHVHEFCGSWMDHPFWRSAFLLDNPQDLKTILSTGLKEVWLDTAKGLDIEGGHAQETVSAEIDQTLARANAPQQKIEHLDIAEEAARALRICSQSKQAVASMFNEARMGKAINADDAQPIVEEISNSVMRNPSALISLARLKNKDEYTYMHSVAVCALMVSLARQLGLNGEQIRQAGMAGLLHDVGKMMISPDILNKPGKLTLDEFETMKSHPAEGHRMLLEGSGVSEVALDVCLHHHEKMDGSGYPDGLAGDAIPISARIMALADVFDALISLRVYKRPLSYSEARDIIEAGRGRHFDPDMVDAFLAHFSTFCDMADLHRDDASKQDAEPVVAGRLAGAGSC
ncbi:MAG: HD-GYP domain-containing protein, partial [Thiobacillus sp.]|nr:HD-GYP domain-containing protein [Thiobacillus sp.]